MIIPISLRDKHQEDMEVIKWYESIPKSERSREIRRVLLENIRKELGTCDKQPAYNVSTKENRTKTPVKPMKRINIIEETSEEDLDILLDNIGIGG